MRMICTVSSREEMIELGQKIGTRFKDAAGQEQNIIVINGTPNSGKSLLALAIDQVFQPQLYPSGIRREWECSADEDLNGAKYARLPVVFANFSHTQSRITAEFERTLKNFARRNRGAKILIASNLPFSMDNNPDIQKDIFSLRYLDMHIEVTGPTQQNQKDIAITVKDPSLLPR